MSPAASVTATSSSPSDDSLQGHSHIQTTDPDLNRSYVQAVDHISEAPEGLIVSESQATPGGASADAAPAKMGRKSKKEKIAEESATESLVDNSETISTAKVLMGDAASVESTPPKPAGNHAKETDGAPISAAAAVDTAASETHDPPSPVKRGRPKKTVISEPADGIPSPLPAFSDTQPSPAKAEDPGNPAEVPFDSFDAISPVLL